MLKWLKNATGTSAVQLSFPDASKLCKLLLFQGLAQIYEMGGLNYSASVFIDWSGIWMHPEWRPLLTEEGQVVMHEDKPVNKQVLNVPLPNLANALMLQLVEPAVQRYSHKQKTVLSGMNKSLTEFVTSNTLEDVYDTEAALCVTMCETMIIDQLV